MKTACRVIVLMVVVAATAQAGEFLHILKPGCWVCGTPEAYDQAVAEERRLNGNAEDLRRQLLEQKLCMWVDDEMVEKMMVPYARILERQGDKVRVEFTVELRKRIAILHRQISRITYAGWTEAANLREREIL